MTERIHSPIRGSDENRYATCEDFMKIFDEDRNVLYELSFLLTGDHQKGEGCFVSGIEDCAQENRVFMEWGRAWTKRAIVKNAIRELNPRPKHSTASSVPSVFSHNRQSSGSSRTFRRACHLRACDFERFVFVLYILEHYREYECALLLGCSVSQVRDACIRAIEELVSSGQADSSRDEDRKCVVSRTA